MKIVERIWLILFTLLELVTPFVCYFYKESLSYEILLLAIPLGMAFLYICLFGVERPFETDVTELCVFQVYIVLAGIILFIFSMTDIPKGQFEKLGITRILLGLGSLGTVLIQDIIFVIIFIVVAKLLGLESVFAKNRKEYEEFYQKDREPYGGYRNVYEKMYWEELERRQREEFKNKWRGQGSNNSDYDRWYEWKNKQKDDNAKHDNTRQTENKTRPKRFMFENTVYFQSIDSLEQVRPRYISLMKRYHPDMKGGSKEICQEIQSEYDKICEENGL
ncbi:MAG: hypothetical protein IJN92_02665 [Lachnospiraceae bacterium]|nr:hypothetical protein [Lachnospiraceae bacterium]